MVPLRRYENIITGMRSVEDGTDNVAVCDDSLYAGLFQPAIPALDPASEPYTPSESTSPPPPSRSHSSTMPVSRDIYVAAAALVCALAALAARTYLEHVGGFRSPS